MPDPQVVKRPSPEACAGKALLAGSYRKAARFTDGAARNLSGRSPVMRKTLMCLALSSLLGFAAVPGLHASDLRHDRKEIRHDRRDLHHDRQDRRHDRREVRHDRRQGDVKELRKDRRDLRHDRRDTRHDRKDLRRDHRDRRHDRRHP
jgi:hypothetical protein